MTGYAVYLIVVALLILLADPVDKAWRRWMR